MTDPRALLPEMDAPSDNGGDPLEASGLARLVDGADPEYVGACLRKLRTSLPADPLERRLLRNRAIKVLKDARIADAARLVDAALPGAPASADAPGQAVAVNDPEPWPQPVDGARWLDRTQALFTRYLVLPDGAPDFFAAFALVTHAQDAFAVAPYAALCSPAPGCGKTLALEVLELVVRRGWRPAVLTGPVLFRAIEDRHPTLLLDEAEVVRGRSDAADNVRAMLHVGYRRGAVVERCVGEDFRLRAFQVFGPKVFAAMGDLPPTLLSRCVVVPMRRRNPQETVDRFRLRDVAPDGLELRQQAQRWAGDNLAALRDARPALPDFLNDRQQEVWEPLYAVAGIAGGPWPARIARAAELLSRGSGTGTQGVELLADIRAVLGVRDLMLSADLADGLNALEGRPWAEGGRGKGLTPNRLARLLAPFGIAPGNLRVGDKVQRGYRAEAFADAFARYLGDPASATATPRQPAPPLDQLDSRQPLQPGGVAVVDSAETAGGTGDVAALWLSARGGPGLETDVPLPGGEGDSDPDPDDVARAALQVGA